jgi:hypothetical protein
MYIEHDETNLFSEEFQNVEADKGANERVAVIMANIQLCRLMIGASGKDEDGTVFKKVFAVSWQYSSATSQTSLIHYQAAL